MTPDTPSRSQLPLACKERVPACKLPWSAGATRPELVGPLPVSDRCVLSLTGGNGTLMARDLDRHRVAFETRRCYQAASYGCPSENGSRMTAPDEISMRYTQLLANASSDSPAGSRQTDPHM